MLMLSACCHPKPIIRTYEYCKVLSVEERKAGSETFGWVSQCEDGTEIFFVKPVKAGDGVYYSPYQEWNFPTVYGYIKRIDEGNISGEHIRQDQ